MVLTGTIRWASVMAATVALLVSAAGCDNPPSLTVRARTTVRAGLELGYVEVDLYEEAQGCSGEGAPLASGGQSVAIGDQAALVAGSFGVHVFERLRPGLYAVRARFRAPPPSPSDGPDAGAVLAVRCVLTQVRANRVLVVHLTSGCVDLDCPQAGDAPARTSCINGRCVEPDCDPSDPAAQEFCEDALCGSDVDCQGLVPCGGARCLDGLCFVPVGGSCPAGEYCSQVTGRCTPDVAGPTEDAGLVDAGRIDAATDAGACEPSSCVAGPCERAECVGDRCVRTSLCGMSQVCCDGTCADRCGDFCAGMPAGTICRMPANECQEPALCDGTSDGCPANPVFGMETACGTDGIFCNGAEVCVAGACTGHVDPPCPGTCDEESDSCGDCSGSGSCAPDDVGAWSACAYATECAQTGEQTRSVTRYTCVDGTCTGETTEQSRTMGCDRVTARSPCGEAVYGDWSECAWEGDPECSTTGTRTRAARTFSCRFGSCEPADDTESEPCERTTEGSLCEATSCRGNFCVGGSCNVTCVWDGSRCVCS